MITKFNTSTPLTVVTAYKVVRKTVWSIAETEDLLLFISSGNVQYEVNGEIYNLKKGDVLFLPRGTEYLRKPLDDDYYTVYHLHFYKDSTQINLADAQRELINLSAKKEDLPIGEYYVTSTANVDNEAQLIIDAFERIIRLREKEEVKNSIFESASAEYILSILAEKSQPQIISGLKIEKLETFPDALKDAIFYVKTHLNEKITLADLCKIALVSPQQLIRYFKKFTGKTPNEYVSDYKINVARDYITRSKELSIKTIAYELGYDDQCYFSRVFSKTTGESPTEYYYRVKNFKNK